MEITINDQRKIFAVQNEFSEGYPYLKLEFFSKPHKQGGASSKKLMKHISKTIAECRTVHKAGHIMIQPHMTVAELEQGFRDVYGLSIEVFSKAGDKWIEATEADIRTLEQQNDAGRKFSLLEEVL